MLIDFLPLRKKEKLMSKYAPLEKHLKSEGHMKIPMTFDQIESIIEDALPPSARKHRAWWSNNPTNSVITYAWLAAGYKTADVNLEGEHVVFVKSETVEAGAHHPVFGCMKGTITVPAGEDVTQPAMPEWADMTRAPKVFHG
ncbi:MAG: DUF7662 domain-containing protein [Marinibacterium sp.]